METIEEKRLTVCPDCQNPVSTSASKCPKCGRALNSLKIALEIVAFVIIVLIILFGIQW